MATPNTKYLKQLEDNPARWEALEVLANDPSNFYRTELDTAGAEKYRNAGGFSIVENQKYNDALKAAGEAKRKVSAAPETPAPSMPPRNAAESVARLNQQAGRTGIGLATIQEMGQDEAALSGRRSPRPGSSAEEDAAYAAAGRADRERILDRLDGATDLSTPRGFQGLSPEMLADAESGVSTFQQGLRLKGQGAAPPAQRGSGSRPTITVGKPGDAGVLREPVALSAPVRSPAPVPDAEGVAMRTTPAGDEEFAAAQDEGRTRALAVALSRAGARASEAISGVRGDAGVYDALASETGNPVRDLIARREADKRKALEDPASEQSMRFQQAVRKALPGVYSEQEVAGMTAADEPLLFKAGEMRMRLDQRAADMGREDARLAGERAWRTEQASLARQDRRDAMADRASERGLRREEMQALLSQKQQEQQAVRAEQQTERLAKEYADTGAPGFVQQHQTAKAIMDANTDLPGFGPLAGRLPDAMTSDDGVRLRQAVGQMLAEYRKGITGAGMSDSERAEYERITGLLESGTEDRVRLGVDSLKASMDARVQALAAGKRPDAVATYGERNPVFRRQVDSQATAAQTSAPRREVRNGKTYEYDNGQWFEVL